MEVKSKMDKTHQPDSPTENNSNGNSKLSNLSHARYCHIVKRPDFDGYGFNLHSEKIKPGQYIGKVDANSPAEEAGLREGDQIIEVNGVNIGNETHKQVVQRIKAISNEVRLLLIDPNMTHLNKSPNKLSTKENYGNECHDNGDVNSTISQTIIDTDTMKSQTKEIEKNDFTNYSISMATMDLELQPNYNNDTTVDVTELDGHCITITNGNSSTALPASVAQISTPSLITSNLQKPAIFENTASDDTSSSLQNKTALDLNLTVAEMRAKLSAKKKLDPKNEYVDIKKKFDIIQKL